ncbi:TonB-dependent receptor [Marinilabilia sp.]|uniref:TonB-dependent receptor n=1 Tax=Marinilabilia sp. TaxID=2021252 RepID=UPI0025BC1420|nr:TonB-dependent receptor [Marinilabilia sp.]
MKTNLKFLILIVPLLFVYQSVLAQTLVKGCVADKRTGEPLPSVNVYVKDSYDGTITGPDGCYELSVQSDSDFILVFSFVGYQSIEKTVLPTENITLDIELKESITNLNAVTITAGSFEAGDKKRAAVMDPMDIYTTAGSLGDIGTALKTLPGTQVSPDDGRLLVRGGDASETRVLMDGVLAAKPYYSKIPDLPTRGRFSPSLFEGTFFSTGGYSAEFGQALSSVLILESQDVAVEELTSLSLMSIGGELARTWVGSNRSFSATGGYFNFSPYNSLVKNHIDWEEDVEAFNANINYRQKGEKGGLFKLFASGDYGGQSFKVPDGSGDILTIDETGGNVYVNSTYHHSLTDKTLMKLGVSYTYDDQDFQAGIHNQQTAERVTEGKVKLISQLENGFKITYGGAWQKTLFDQTYRQTESGFLINTNFSDDLLSGFAEAEWRLNSRIAFRPGLRFEHSSQSDEQLFSPRVAMAISTGENTTLSMAWGHFFQSAQSDFLKYNRNINMQKAEHFILGLQSGSLATRLFRVEAYYKDYSKLITGEYNDFGEFVPFENSGNGYAKGVDFFYRDKTLIKNTDFWVSYSFINSERKFLDYTEKVTPEFISPHTFSFVAKHFVSPIRSQIGLTWMWNSGRPYHIPGDDEFMGHTSPNYSDLGANLSYLTSLFGQFTIVHFSMSNVLGRKNILGYRRVALSGDDGNASLITLRPDVEQFMFLGVFISIN